MWILVCRWVASELLLAPNVKVDLKGIDFCSTLFFSLFFFSPSSSFFAIFQKTDCILLRLPRKELCPTEWQPVQVAVFDGRLSDVEEPKYH